MNKYQNGKIYKLTSKETDKIYIGSTFRSLKQRFFCHISEYRNPEIERRSNSHMLCKYTDCKIELIEDFPCNNKTELFERESYYFDLYENIRVNTIRPIALTFKVKYALNINGLRDKTIERAKQYKENNKEKVLQKKREYHHKNKESISEKKKETYTCECGSTLRKNDRCRHERSQKHQDYISN